MRLILLGNSGIEHVGSHFREAAAQLNIDLTFVDASRAYDGPYISRKINWWLRGRRPGRIREISAEVVRLCRQHNPALLLATGFAPLHLDALREIGAIGVSRVNYLTDDPWNPIHKAPWFMEALPQYDYVFTPRRANMRDLQAAECRNVAYLPFGFEPKIHFTETISESERRLLESDIIFAGGGDADRVPYIGALRKAGFRIALYGGYWDRFRETRGLSRGMADPSTLRKAIAASRIALCLVRRRNRDGHSMRTFEVPACGACPLVERTEEHEQLFGADETRVAYFETIPQMIAKTEWLVTHDSERNRLASAAQALVTTQGHSYLDRLCLILKAIDPRTAASCQATKDIRVVSP